MKPSGESRPRYTVVTATNWLHSCRTYRQTRYSAQAPDADRSSPILLPYVVTTQEGGG